MLSYVVFLLHCLSFKWFIPSHICLFVFCVFSVLIPPPTGTHTTSCPMVSTTTAQAVPPSCIATGEVWAQCRALPSPSSLPPPQPPPPAPLVHGHVLHQPCCQTTLLTAHWAPQWCLHHESPAGRFVHLLWVDGQHISIRLVHSLCTRAMNIFILHFFSASVEFKIEKSSKAHQRNM